MFAEDVSVEVDSDRFVTTNVAGDMFILDQQTSETFRIGGVGTRLWSLFVLGETPRGAALVVAQETGVGYARALRDAIDFVVRLEDAGIVRTGPVSL